MVGWDIRPYRDEEPFIEKQGYGRLRCPVLGRVGTRVRTVGILN